MNSSPKLEFGEAEELKEKEVDVVDLEVRVDSSHQFSDLSINSEI